MFSYVEGGADSGLAVVSASTVVLLARAAGTEIATELYRVLEVGGEGLDRAMDLLDDRAPGISAAIVEVRDAPIALWVRGNLSKRRGTRLPSSGHGLRLVTVNTSRWRHLRGSSTAVSQ